MLTALTSPRTGLNYNWTVKTVPAKVLSQDVSLALARVLFISHGWYLCWCSIHVSVAANGINQKILFMQ